MTSHLLERLLELWGEKQPDERYARRPRVEAATVRSTLEQEFGADSVNRELAAYLLERGRAQAQGVRTAAVDVFLTNAAFELCKPESKRRLDSATIATLVCELPSVGFYSVLTPWVKLYFDQAALLRVLARGCGAAEVGTRSSSLYGMQMYFHEAAPSSDQALYEALLDFEAALRTQVEDPDPVVAETADTALKRVWELREARPLWPKLTADEVTAYRHDDGGKTTFTVERSTDAYVVLRIPSFDVLADRIVIEYRNQEPTLLPEDVPFVLERTLLEHHLSAEARSRASVLELVNLRAKRSVTKVALGL